VWESEQDSIFSKRKRFPGGKSGILNELLFCASRQLVLLFNKNPSLARSFSSHALSLVSSGSGLLKMFFVDESLRRTALLENCIVVALSTKLHLDNSRT